MDEDEGPHLRAYAGAVRSAGVADARTSQRWRAADLSAGPLPRRPVGAHSRPEPEPSRDAGDSSPSGEATGPGADVTGRPLRTAGFAAYDPSGTTSVSGVTSAADMPQRGDTEPLAVVDDGRLLPALLAALFCFPPTGVAAVNQALLARDRRAVGDLAGANAALGHARRFAVVSLILGALLYLAVFLIAVAVGAG